MADPYLLAASGQHEPHMQVMPEPSTLPPCRVSQTPPCGDDVQDEPYCPYKCFGAAVLCEPCNAASITSHIGPIVTSKCNSPCLHDGIPRFGDSYYHNLAPSSKYAV